MKKILSVLFPSSVIAGALFGAAVVQNDAAPETQADVSNTLAHAGASDCPLPYEGGLGTHLSQSNSGEVFVVGCGGVF